MPDLLRPVGELVGAGTTAGEDPKGPNDSRTAGGGQLQGAGQLADASGAEGHADHLLKLGDAGLEVEEIDNNCADKPEAWVAHA
jgi:hypothetical protein